MSQTYQYGDYNRGGMLAFTFTMVVTIVFFVYVGFIHSGVDLKELQESQPQVEGSEMKDASEAGSSKEEQQ